MTTHLKLNIGLFVTLFFLFSTAVFAQQADASLELTPSTSTVEAGDEFEVDIVLKNPSEQSIISVRTWLEYDPQVLEGLEIDTGDSPFSLAAPGEDEFSAEEGLVKIGRSNITQGFDENEVTVATIRFKVKGSASSSIAIEPHDYQVTELGHTSVNIIEGSFPANILQDEPDGISLSLGSTAQVVETITEIPNDSGDELANLSRPLSLKINTGSGYVDLKWDMGLDSELQGYYLYYGRTSGQYTRQRNVNRVDAYRLDGLNDGETYYFAITAYDSEGKESDYSDEVAIIVGEPLSSTSPFDDLSQNNAASVIDAVQEHPRNGPIVGWVAFSAMGLGGTLMFRKKIPCLNKKP